MQRARTYPNSLSNVPTTIPRSSSDATLGLRKNAAVKTGAAALPHIPSSLAAASAKEHLAISPLAEREDPFGMSSFFPDAAQRGDKWNWIHGEGYGGDVPSSLSGTRVDVEDESSMPGTPLFSKSNDDLAHIQIAKEDTFGLLKLSIWKLFESTFDAEDRLFSPYAAQELEPVDEEALYQALYSRRVASSDGLKEEWSSGQERKESENEEMGPGDHWLCDGLVSVGLL